MKKLFFMLLLALTAVVILPISAEAKRMNLNETVTTTSGCEWEITGGRDVRFYPPRINHYDDWVTDCHGNRSHFVDKAINPSNPNGNTNYADFESQYEEISAPVPEQFPGPEAVFDILISIALNQAQ